MRRIGLAWPCTPRGELHDRRRGSCQTSSAARKSWLPHKRTYSRFACLTMRNCMITVSRGCAHRNLENPKRPQWISPSLLVLSAVKESIGLATGTPASRHLGMIAGIKGCLRSSGEPSQIVTCREDQAPARRQPRRAGAVSTQVERHVAADISAQAPPLCGSRGAA